MKSTFLPLGLLALICQASAESPTPEAKPALSDYETVQTAHHFSIGATGAAATITPAETSLRRILQTPTGAEDCRKLTVTGTSAGRLYGLLGLKILKDAAYRRLRRGIGSREPKFQ